MALQIRWLFVCLLALSAAVASSQQLPQKQFASEIDGRIVVDGDRITVEVLDNPYNGPKQSYSVVMRDGMKYLSVHDQQYLMLVSDKLIYLFNSAGSLFFNGIAGSGRFMEFLMPAKAYIASSSLKEGGIDYTPRNLAYVRADRPWALRVNSIGQYVDMSWDSEVGALFLINGFVSFSKPALYGLNNRVKRVRVSTDAQEPQEVEVADTPDPQLILLNRGARKIRLTILAVYPGSKRNDTCLSMVQGFNSVGIDSFELMK